MSVHLNLFHPGTCLAGDLWEGYGGGGTRYSNGLVRLIPMHVHLTLDVAVGLLLIATPMLLEWDVGAQIPYAAIGLLELSIAALSQNTPNGKPRTRSITVADVR